MVQPDGDGCDRVHTAGKISIQREYAVCENKAAELYSSIELHACRILDDGLLRRGILLDRRVQVDLCGGELGQYQKNEIGIGKDVIGRPRGIA